MYIPRKDGPVHYRLGYHNYTLRIDIRRPIMNQVTTDLTVDSPIVCGLIAALSIPAFSPPSEAQWGFGENLSTTQLNGDWVRVSGQFSNDKSSADRPMHALSASLATLFLVLSYAKLPEEPVNEQQLLSIDCLIAQPGFHGSGFTATISTPLAEWIKRQPQDVYPQNIRKAMAEAYGRLLGRKSMRDLTDFRVRYYEGQRLHMSIPGSCACLAQDGQYAHRQGAYQIDTHNVGTPLQQLTLLAGLGAIVRQTHADIYPGLQFD